MDVSSANCAGCGRAMVITRLECGRCGIAMEGEFEVASLGRLSAEDQVFVHAFLRHHGSIKKMEKVFGISYPTVKNRLNAITTRLDEKLEGPSPNSRILERLACGELTVQEAVEKLS